MQQKEFQIKLGQQIAKLRKQKKISQTDFAYMLNKENRITIKLKKAKQTLRPGIYIKLPNCWKCELNEEQVTAIIENKKVIGPGKDILEVINAVKVSENLSAYNPFSDKSLLAAHKLLMTGLVPGAGKYRKKGVGVVKGATIKHLAPSYQTVPYLMKDLFAYLKKEKEIILIKSCVFHYEIEFIHPFMDGNGRMGRLWQTLLLLKKYTVFEFLPFETLISKNEKAYYKALSLSDNQGKATIFIEYMLGVLDKALEKIT